MKDTQKEWVVGQLKYYGRVSRNTALKNYISRLGAIVHNLKKEGWGLEGDWVKTEYGKDFVYKVNKLPEVLPQFRKEQVRQGRLI